jgi:hypothetical protein
VITTEEKAALDKELMAQKLVQAEREAQASLREQRAAHQEDVQRLQREKVQQAGCVVCVGGQGSELLFPQCPQRNHPCSASVPTFVKQDFMFAMEAWGHLGASIGLGCPYEICKFPGPELGPTLVISMRGVYSHI